MSSLTRVTVRYIDTEDRIRVTGEDEAGRVLTMWLTQRLLNRLLPHLCGWLEQKIGKTPLAEVRQEMAQLRAHSELEPQAPVRTIAQSQSMLITSVDLRVTKATLALVFKDAAGQEVARLRLQSKELRQWLGIVHRQFVNAHWSTVLWPVWIDQAQASVTQTPRSALVH